MIQEISQFIKQALKLDYLPNVEVPKEEGFGHYSTNLAIIEAKKLARPAPELAHELIAQLKEADKNGLFEKIETAGPGFINFTLASDFLSKKLSEALSTGDSFGKTKSQKGEKIIIEYTDPNPFKAFHIGHLMTNAIGEALARNLEWAGAKVKRANYQGDVGMHVAKSIYGMIQLNNETPDKNASLKEKVAFLGKAYALGAKEYELEETKKEIEELNKKIYQQSNPAINKLYKLGRKWSLDYFEQIYKKLGTKFDYYFFESNTAKFGEKLVREWLQKDVFNESNGAIVFDGEKYGLHTRVFINSQGLPTYEAKELGLAKLKYKKCKYSRSIVITGNEIKAYFQVLLKAMSFVFPKLAERTEHFPHGMLRLPEGKMSSRTGEVIEAETLLNEVKSAVEQRMQDAHFPPEEKKEISNAVSVSAVKYSILRAAAKNDIVFDLESSISLSGASGPYIQYSYARLAQVLKKGAFAKSANFVLLVNKEAKDLAAKLIQFPDIVDFSAKTLATNHIATYAYQLAKLTNRFYEEVPILKEEDKEIKAAKLALAKISATTLKNSLEILGIEAPGRI
ncbi:MAG: arginine--tRNA ligase [bacterium]|nr:arginine--tRNA ligase [bacterium]